ncbi:hypothetical protein BGZ96_011070 [Linnemannia gamsii]|uniref:Uncharacterized protein n=1 Tax=Linnemannia gamsii TaxID=64522 RepID=A0ABQ7JSZ0_9FUNG|nr:hypothetical protein BGZ96_011070 [Linnemannia gamsii]
MDTTASEHKLVFLNELHETLKRLNPRRVDNAGLFRILGRLVEYDMDRQIVKVESCFHDEYTSQPIVMPTSNGDNRRHHKNTTAVTTTKRKMDDDDALKHNHGQTPQPSKSRSGRQKLKDFGRRPAGAESHKNSANNNNKSTTIDLTLDSDNDDDDDDDERQDKGEDDVIGEQEVFEPVSPSKTDQQQLHADMSKKWCVDLTVSTDDEQDPLPSPSDVDDDYCHDEQEATTVTTTKPRRAPKVILWVDTQLLSARVFEPHALFQFMGEVVYSTTIGTSILTSTGSSSMEVVKDRAKRGGGGGGGHWVMQARTARLMDGLDLYSYRQAILMTRDLVLQYQQRDRDRELAKEKAER